MPKNISEDELRLKVQQRDLKMNDYVPKIYYKRFKRIMEKAKLTHSISRVGRCIDNGPIEDFWGTLKVEKYYLYKFETYEALKHAIDTYIKFNTTNFIKKH